MRGFLISQMRRRLGLAAVQAMARHRLSGACYVGVPRQVVVARPRRGVQGSAREVFDPSYFFAFQGNAGGVMGA